MNNNNLKSINSIGWTILGVIGGAAILSASMIMRLIKSKKDVITEKQKEFIGFSVMFSEYIKQGKQNLSEETKKIEFFLKDKINRSGLNDISLQIRELIKNRSIDSKTFAEFYRNMNYSIRLQMFRVLVSYQKNKPQFKEAEYSLKEMAELLGLNSGDYESVLAMSNPGLKSAYKILQVNENSGIDEVKMAFRRLSKLYHPDKVEHLGEEFKNEAIKNFQNVLDAYELIKKTAVK
ncbi:MAG: DnaJ domain-containing protein [Bacteroidota bacterium]